MLIKFTVSNFLSFNEPEEFSMEAGKARKYSKRIYNVRNTKLTKCKMILGANASGKSNLIEACQFIQDMISDGFPTGFSNKFFRQKEENRESPSKFEIEIICDKKRFCYGFTIVLNTGNIQKEWLYELTTSGGEKCLFRRDTSNEFFEVGDFFRNKDAVMKLNNYGEDISGDHEVLFLNIINKNKVKMFKDFPELKYLRDIYRWFTRRLNISFPTSMLTGYPYFTDSNLDEIAEILNALGTGISDLKIVEIPVELVKNKIPEDIYNKIITDLEKSNARAKTESSYHNPSIVVRSYKEFYTFNIDKDDRITIRTIEFCHENKSVYFKLNEESDGTARLLDLIELLFRVSDNQIFIIDEIDRCLHPVMTVKIIELFLKMAEKRNTQLVITSHESRLLAAEILRNDEICFVIKDSSGATVINPLEKYQLRADKKIYAALFDGTLDAVPHFEENKLNKLIETESKIER